ncbi:hypothetical protein BDN70DRAFT_900668, partial [Pholiota conissans]
MAPSSSKKVHGSDKPHQSSSSSDSTGDTELDTKSQDQRTKEPGAQGQTLLTALHNLIVPLVQNVVPHASGPCQFSENPEAEHLLVALQKYIASVITQLRSSIDLEVLDMAKAPDTKCEDESAQERTNYTDQGQTDINIESPLHIPFFSLENLLGVLRQRVFNRLPIRLLCFEKLGNADTLKISLLNQAELYSYLSKKFTIIHSANPIDPAELWDDLNSLT